MQLIFYEKKKLAIPSIWEELSGKQLKRLAVLLHSGKEKEETAIRALHILSNKNLIRFWLLPLDLRFRALPFVEWINKQELICQLLPEVKGFYGPCSDFDNLTMVEFHYSEMAYCQLVKNKEERFLTELISALYREKKHGYDNARNEEGDCRKPFSHGLFEYGQQKIDRWPTATKLAILLWYDGCRQNLVNEYPAIYPLKTESGENQFEGMYKMMRSITGDKYGTMEQVEKLGVHTAHLEISCMMEEQAQMQKELEKI